MLAGIIRDVGHVLHFILVFLGYLDGIDSSGSLLEGFWQKKGYGTWLFLYSY